MSSLVSRRAILQFFSATAACTLLEPLARHKLLGAAPEALAARRQPFVVHPCAAATSTAGLPAAPELPRYRTQHWHGAAASGNTQLATYTVIDDVVVPPEYERYVIVHWGDRVFPNDDDYVGYNADYTGFVPISDDDDDDHDRGGELRPDLGTPRR